MPKASATAKHALRGPGCAPSATPQLWLHGCVAYRGACSALLVPAAPGLGDGYTGPAVPQYSSAEERSASESLVPTNAPSNPRGHDAALPCRSRKSEALMASVNPLTLSFPVPITLQPPRRPQRQALASPLHAGCRSALRAGARGSACAPATHERHRRAVSGAAAGASSGAASSARDTPVYGLHCASGHERRGQGV